MQLSHYLKVWSSPDQPGYFLLFSTKMASLALVPEDDLAALEQGDITEDLEEQLVELGMLVLSRQEERVEMYDYIHEINRLCPTVDIAVILGLACNFSCVYCYEGSMKGSITMADATADQLVAFARQRVSQGKKKLQLDFYGGEPLLYVPLIKRITTQLKPWAEEQSLEFLFTLVSNGSLLTRPKVEQLLPLGLEGVKITLDGPPEVHDRLRPFKSGQPSFAAIIANVRECCDLVKIGLGGNFTRDSFQEFPRLFEVLAQEGVTPEKVGRMRFAPVSQTADQFANPEFTGGCVSCDEPWVAEATLLLREETLKHGFQVSKVRPSLCMVDMADAVTVNHDGDIFKCPAQIGHKKFAVGDIWTGINDYSALYHLNHWQREEKCQECVYLPLCFGGCRDMRFQREGDMAEVECQQEFWDRTLEATVKQDIRYRKSDDG